MHSVSQIEIGVIGYETDPVKVKRAFQLGCAGVIIDGNIPEQVQVELARVAASRNRELITAMLLHQTKDTKVWKTPSTQLRLTQEWLKVQAEWAEDAKLRPSRKPAFDSEAKNEIIMTVWPQKAFDYRWHIDLQDHPLWQDLHFHVCGEGMVIAVPEKRPITIPLNYRSFEIKAEDASIDTLQVADDALREMGFKLVSLQPGQMLAFNDRCLHRSSVKVEDGFKLRAAMF